MNARSMRILPVVLVLVPLAHAASYPIRNLDPNDAWLALSSRIPELNEDCHTTTRRATDPRDRRR